MKNKKKIFKIIIIILIIVLLISFIGYLGIKYLKKDDTKPNEVKIVKRISAFDYNLKENETKLYKDTFDELVNILNTKDVSYEEYAKCISKLFVIDFYTLNNKLSKNDVGGTDFIYPDMVDNFIEEARSTFYKYIQTNNGDNKNSNLPEVSEIESVTLEETTFNIKSKGSTENAYRVSIKWAYKEDTDYEKEANMILVRNDKKLYIVEMD